MSRAAAWRTLRWAALGLGVVFGAIQLVPYGWHHPNPPIVDDVPWPDARAEQIARQSCYACHSNETDWPWYSYVAPMSWVVRSDVESGRDELNFSNWDDFDSEADDAIEEILEGSMPPRQYTAIHRSASLTAEEKAILIDALRTLDDL